jgi:hypothetical protein
MAWAAIVGNVGFCQEKSGFVIESLSQIVFSQAEKVKIPQPSGTCEETDGWAPLPDLIVNDSE